MGCSLARRTPLGTTPPNAVKPHEGLCAQGVTLTRAIRVAARSLRSGGSGFRFSLNKHDDFCIHSVTKARTISAVEQQSRWASHSQARGLDLSVGSSIQPRTRLTAPSCGTVAVGFWITCPKCGRVHPLPGWRAPGIYQVVSTRDVVRFGTPAHPRLRVLVSCRSGRCATQNGDG